jgi:hypothetical protein
MPVNFINLVSCLCAKSGQDKKNLRHQRQFYCKDIEFIVETQCIASLHVLINFNYFKKECL